VPEVRVLRRIADELSRASGELADGEATVLWAAVAGLTPAEVWLKKGSEPDEETVRRFWKAVEQRRRGVPFAYAAGSVGFRTLDLAIDPRALIPRPETEGLVEIVLRETDPRPGGIVADVGTGCGCIALSLAVEGRFDEVVAVERSPGAAALARENIARLSPRTPVVVREGNLLDPLRHTGKRFRAIVSNPPYISTAEYAALDRSVRDFEPAEALVAGRDGLDATRVLLQGAAPLLEPGGILALEIDEHRSDAVRALATQHGWVRVDIHADLFGRPRYALAVSKED
jgi:release factor glutamine methyltransferase